MAAATSQPEEVAFIDCTGVAVKNEPERNEDPALVFGDAILEPQTELLELDDQKVNLNEDHGQLSTSNEVFESGVLVSDDSSNSKTGPDNEVLEPSEVVYVKMELEDEAKEDYVESDEGVAEDDVNVPITDNTAPGPSTLPAGKSKRSKTMWTPPIECRRSGSSVGDPQTLDCEHCKKSFVKKKHLLRHVESKHSDVFHREVEMLICGHWSNECCCVSCDLCGKSFLRNWNLVRHMNHVHETNKPHVCDNCEASFVLEKDLQMHKRYNHRKVKPFYCGVCNVKFRAFGEYNKHNNLVHLRLKPHVCETCERAFGTKLALKNHVQCVHLKVKSFKCNQCKKSFFQKKRLKQHLDFRHKPREAIVCKTCNKTFKNQSYLDSHNDFVHLGLRPFTCQICKKAFDQYCNMSRHSKLVHKVDPAKPT